MAISESYNRLHNITRLPRRLMRLRTGPYAFLDLSQIKLRIKYRIARNICNASYSNEGKK